LFGSFFSLFLNKTNQLAFRTLSSQDHLGIYFLNALAAISSSILSHNEE